MGTMGTSALKSSPLGGTAPASIAARSTAPTSLARTVIVAGARMAPCAAEIPPLATAARRCGTCWSATRQGGARPGRNRTRQVGAGAVDTGPGSKNGAAPPRNPYALAAAQPYRPIPAGGKPPVTPGRTEALPWAHLGRRETRAGAPVPWGQRDRPGYEEYHSLEPG